MTNFKTERNFDNDPIGYLIDHARVEYAGNNLSFLDNALIAWACADAAGLREEICRWHFLTHLGRMFDSEDNHLPEDPFPIIEKSGPCTVFASILAEEFGAEPPITDQERGMVMSGMGERFLNARMGHDEGQPRERDRHRETAELTFALDTSEECDTDEIKTLLAPISGPRP
jgi:hypothetical protein